MTWESTVKNPQPASRCVGVPKSRACGQCVANRTSSTTRGAILLSNGGLVAHCFAPRWESIPRDRLTDRRLRIAMAWTVQEDSKSADTFFCIPNPSFRSHGTYPWNGALKWTVFELEGRRGMNSRVGKRDKVFHRAFEVLVDVRRIQQICDQVQEARNDCAREHGFYTNLHSNVVPGAKFRTIICAEQIVRKYHARSEKMKPYRCILLRVPLMKGKTSTTMTWNPDPRLKG